MSFKHKYFLIWAPLLAFAAWGALGLAKPAGRLANPTTFSVEPISWLRSPDLKPERSAPVVYGDNIFITSSRKDLVVYDFRGKKTIHARLKFAPVASAAVSGGRVFVGGSDGAFHCLAAGSGEEIWAVPFKTIDFSPPAVAGDLVLFATANDRALALSAATGAYRWEYQHIRADDLAVRGIAAPVVVQDTVYMGFSGGAVAALDLAGGRLIWKTNAFSGEQFMDVDGDLAVDDTSVYAVSAGGMLASLSRKTGKVFWSYNSGGMAGLTISGSNLFLATDDAEMIALDKVTGQVKWNTRLTDRESVNFRDLPTRPAVVGGEVVTVTRAGKVVVFDAASGAVSAAKNYFTATSAPVVAVGDGTGFMFIDNKGMIRLWPNGP